MATILVTATRLRCYQVDEIMEVEVGGKEGKGYIFE